ncbi:hypothetical protein GCM10017562_50850 [Streptomyces roseofulvus]
MPTPAGRSGAATGAPVTRRAMRGANPGSACRRRTATSMEHLETLMDELAGFGSTTTSVVYSQTLPYRGPVAPH